MISLEFAVTNPATGVVEETFPTATTADVADAISSAHQAFRTWSRSTSVADRTALIKRVADLHEERREDLAAIIHTEMGKPVEDALIEVDFCADIYAYYADNASGFLADRPIALRSGTGSAVVRREPIGVLLGIMPWNFPYYQVARFAAPNLSVGNPILLKHAPQCPRSAAALQRIFLDAGFPEGCYVNLYATTAQCAEIIADPRVAAVSLTGSERAGSAVGEVAGRNLKKVVLELGGSDPFILLSTTDLDAVVADAVAARIDNAGQVCNGAKRFIVADRLYESFLERFTRSMLAAADGIAPLSSRTAADGIRAQIDLAVAHGATLVGGAGDGAYVQPGVLTGLTPDNPAYDQEFFGPIAIVHRARDEAHAVQLANATSFGLGSYVFTTDADQARRVAEQLEVGMVFINGVMLDASELPFGGTKRSGFGRELGTLGIEEFINNKVIRTV